MVTPNIKSLSVAELLALKADIDKLLQSRRAELEHQLAAIGGGDVRRRGALKGGKKLDEFLVAAPEARKKHAKR